MPVFNKRNRDDKGSGKIKLEDNDNEQNNSSSKKVPFLIGGAVIGAICLTALFLLSSGDGEEESNINSLEPIVTEPVVDEPQFKIQSAEERISEKLSSIYNANACLYGAFVGSNNNAVREGGDFNYFACLYDEGAFGVLLTEGPWAGTRIHVDPRQSAGGVISIEMVSEASLAEDNKTSEFHRLDYDERSAVSSSLASPELTGDGVNLSNKTNRFVHTVREGGQTANAFIISGEPSKGLFEVEIVNGDVYQINLNTGDFYADSLFLNCPDYEYGLEDNCPRNSFEPNKGVLPRLNGLR